VQKQISDRDADHNRNTNVDQYIACLLVFTGSALYESVPDLTVQLYVYFLENQRLKLILFEKMLRNFVHTSLFRPT